MTEPYFQLSTILIAGLLSAWIARLFNIPNILLMLITGCILGPVTGILNPNDLFGDLLLPIVSLSVAIILFEGGLSLDLRKVRKIGPIVILLVVFGTIIGVVLGAAFMYYILELTLAASLLVSSILIITGPTVIVPVLQQLHIKDPVRSILKWESILIDPVGAITAFLIFESLFKSTHSATETISVGLILGLTIGSLIGLAGAFILHQSLKRFLIPDVLQSPVVLLFVIIAYSLSNAMQSDSGLVAVTVMGVWLANQKSLPVKHIVEFKESLRVILIAFLFITLAASVDLKKLINDWDEALGISLFLLLIVRPIVVGLSTLGSGLNWKEKLLMVVISPRGIVSAAVASLFALELTHMGFDAGEWLSPLVFGVIAITVCISALGAFILAPRLGLSSTFEPGVLIIGANAFARELGQALSNIGLRPFYIDTDFWKVSEAKQLKGDVFLGSFMAFEEEHPDTLSKTGTVLALTENDGINSLAVNHFSRYLERERLYQFHPEKEEIPEHLTGRGLFTKDINHSKMRQLIKEGASIRTTKLSPQFTYKDWTLQYPDAVPLFLLPANAPLINIQKPEIMNEKKRGHIVFIDKTPDV